jgi:translation elongation factor EF-Ts
MIAVKPEEVREMRETSGMGMMECKRIIIRRQIVEHLANANTVDELRVVLQAMLDYLI